MHLWTDPVVLSLAAMLVWLIAAEVFRLVYPAARRGRKVAYLTLASFVFLVIALASFTLLDNVHGPNRADSQAIAQHLSQSAIRNPQSAIARMNTPRPPRHDRLQPQAFQPGGPRAACLHAGTNASTPWPPGA